MTDAEKKPEDGEGNDRLHCPNCHEDNMTQFIFEGHSKMTARNVTIIRRVYFCNTCSKMFVSE